MRRSKQAKLLDAQLHKGYTHIYDDLVGIWSRELVWWMGLFFLNILAASLLIPLAWMHPSPLTVVIVYGLVIIGSIIFIYVWLIYFLGTAVTIDPLKEAPVLAVRMMTGVAQPYSKKATGLAYHDIKHLRRIAEIEQNAADWRGSFVGFVIIGTLSVLIWGFPSVWRWLNEPPEPVTAQPPVSSIEPFWGDSLFLLLYTILVAVILLVAIIRFIWNMLNYFRLFLGSEAANRVILKACEESLAFLEKQQLQDRDSFSFREKRAIAAHFDCRIVPEHAASWADKFWTWGFEPDGTKWYLVPPPRHSRIQNMRLKLRGLRLRIGSKRLRKPRR